MELSNDHPSPFEEPDEISRLVDLVSELGTSTSLQDEGGSYSRLSIIEPGVADANRSSSENVLG